MGTTWPGGFDLFSRAWATGHRLPPKGNDGPPVEAGANHKIELNTVQIGFRPLRWILARPLTTEPFRAALTILVNLSRARKLTSIR